MLQKRLMAIWLKVSPSTETNAGNLFLIRTLPVHVITIALWLKGEFQEPHGGKLLYFFIVKYSKVMAFIGLKQRSPR